MVLIIDFQLITAIGENYFPLRKAVYIVLTVRITSLKVKPRMWRISDLFSVHISSVKAVPVYQRLLLWY
jgi:hypothetical protein